MGPDSAASDRSPASSGHSSRRERGARSGQYVCVFRLGGQRYALDAVLVGEVVSVPQLLPVPQTPPWLLGLCNLRGLALAVVDLGRVLDLAGAGSEPPPSGAVPVLVLRAGTVAAGARIERIDAVYPFESARLTASAAIDEHPAVKGLLTFEARGGFVATLLDEQRLASRLSELRFRKPLDGGMS